MQTDDSPKLWKDMTPEEKGALLLAQHEGRPIEYYNSKRLDKWCEVKGRSIFCDFGAYRVKPEPVRVTRAMTGLAMSQAGQPGWASFSTMPGDGDTHRITFDIVDGVIDCSSVKMEEL